MAAGNTETLAQLVRNILSIPLKGLEHGERKISEYGNTKISAATINENDEEVKKEETVC